MAPKHSPDRNSMRRVVRPLLDIDPVLLLSTLTVGAILFALIVPSQIWSGAS